MFEHFGDWKIQGCLTSLSDHVVYWDSGLSGDHLWMAVTFGMNYFGTIQFEVVNHCYQPILELHDKTLIT